MSNNEPTVGVRLTWDLKSNHLLKLNIWNVKNKKKTNFHTVDPLKTILYFSLKIVFGKLVAGLVYCVLYKCFVVVIQILVGHVLILSIVSLLFIEAYVISAKCLLHLLLLLIFYGFESLLGLSQILYFDHRLHFTHAILCLAFKLCIIHILQILIVK